MVTMPRARAVVNALMMLTELPLVLKTTSNGRSEVLGGFNDTTTAGKLAPMLVTDNSSVFTFFNEVCYGGNPFETLLRETRGTETKTVKRNEGMTAPYVSRMPNSR